MQSASGVSPNFPNNRFKIKKERCDAIEGVLRDTKTVMISMVKETDFNFINVMETVKFNQKKD